ncbi:Maf/Ham1 [Amanita rubescens]|nr:Maf/Ham1 [Amanita rubescens]
MPNHILPHALSIPIIQKLKDKRIVLASNSPRREEILRAIGLQPDIVPSTFEENLPLSEFEDIHEYPVATALHKAVEVYERMVKDDPNNAPDLVIAADTVVLTQPQASTLRKETPDAKQELLEKPTDKADNLRMLLDLNGNVCEVVTGVTVAYPILTSPGYRTRSIEERTLVHFPDNPKHLIEAYVESQEGIDRAGGFAIQGLGSVLVGKIDGDYNNVVGFPAASFLKFLELLMEEDPDFLEE